MFYFLYLCLFWKVAGEIVGGVGCFIEEIGYLEKLVAD